MRVLFISLASASHYYPMVPLAWAFRTAGHEVRVAGQPPIIDPIIGSGMTSVEVGGSYDLLAELKKSDEVIISETGQRLGDFGNLADIPADTLRRHLSIRGYALHKTAEAMIGDLAPFVMSWRPDLVITDPTALAGPLAAQIGNSFLLSLSGGQLVSPQKVPEHETLHKELMVNVVRLYERYGATPTAATGQRMIIPCPSSLIKFRPDNALLARYVPYNGSGAEPTWLHEPTDLPRICISWSLFGQGAAGWTTSHLSTLVEALTDLDAEIIVTTGPATTQPDLKKTSGKVRFVKLLPLQAIMPTAALAVSHGGAGSMLTAVSYGVPQILLPQQQEQIMNGELIASLGAGAWFKSNNIDAAFIAKTASEMITDDKWAKSARGIQQENAAQPAPSQLVKTIEELIDSS